MFDRLIRIDLRRLDAVAPWPGPQVGVALALLTIIGVLRLAIDAVVPGVIPFALLYPAVLIATIAAGWVSGALVMAVGGGVVWFLFLEPTRSFALARPSEGVILVLFFVSASAIIAFAEALRRATSKLAGGQAAVKESEARLDMAVAAAGLGVWEWRRERGRLILSDKAREICGFPARGPVTIQMVAAIIHPDDRAMARLQTRRALAATRRDDSTFEYRIVTPAGAARRIALNGRAVFETVGGVTRASRFIGALRDVTARRAAQAERGKWATRLRLAVEAGRLAVWESDQDSGLVHGPEFNAILGFPPDKRLTAEEVRGLYLPGELERLRSITSAAFERGERHVEVESRFRRPDGALRWMLMRGELTLNAEGKPRALVGVAMDITDRRNAEERMEVLAREVNHRSNNLLAVVQSIVQLSVAATPEALRRVLIGRITALGRAHQLLSEARWEGADLRRLVEEELLAFSLGDVARVSIHGEDVSLSPAAAQALAMALHELATNASKYGALSTQAGRVAVSWTHEGDGPLTIRWVESGGPSVAPPKHKGMGTAMMARALASGLRGETTMEWRPGGLFCEIKLPGEAMENELVA